MNQRPDQISQDIFEQINSICKDFRRAVKDGRRPPIDQWFKRLDGSAQTTLFSNLLEIEIRYRERASESPTSGEYVKRFPQFASQIRQAFDESTIDSMEGLNRGTPQDSKGQQITWTLEIPEANRLGDYELVRELGRGGFGVVYEARNLTRNNRVALKTLPTGVDGQEINADRLHKFRREFRSLSEINHPNLVGMQTLEVDGSQWFFTMDLIEGENFLSYVRLDGELNETRLRASVKLLAKGIMALHERNIIHRDLKPSNVLVEPDGRVVILDFGLVAQVQTAADMTVSRSGMFVGTPRYAAPEQMFGERSEASDWYALGVMLHEALTGQSPFTGKQMEVLRQKQSNDPPRLVERNDLHKDLNDIAALADGLLKRDPKLRPTSGEIVTALGIDLETRTHGSKQGSHGSSGSVDNEQLDLERDFDEEVVLIGREEQLSQLESARLEFLETRQPMAVWVRGLSGEGKSSLVEQFLAPIRRGTEMLVLSGRCYDRESVPFKAIDCLTDSLVRFLRSRPTDELAALLPQDIEMLAQLFPVLRRVAPIADRAERKLVGLDEKQVRNLAFAALRDLLVAIGQTSPIVLFVDDLQWGDTDSAEALAKLLAPPNPPAVLFLGSYRSDEINDSPFLRGWNAGTTENNNGFATRTVQVEPLTEAQCLDFLHSRFGQFDETLQRNVAELFTSTRGNPYFLEQLIEGYDAEKGSFTTVPLTQIIANRLCRCPNQADRLLDVIAIAGKAVPVAEIAAVTRQAESALATITHMRSERLLRLVGSYNEQLVDTYHDKIRETVIDSLDIERRRALHRQYAELIEAEVSAETSDARTERVFDLAHHFLEARDPRAFQYQLAAGQTAIETYAMENALGHVRTAMRIRPNDLPPGTEYQLVLAHAKALSGCNHMVDAIEQYQQALQQTDTPSERASCLFALGEIHWRRSEYELGYRRLRESFAELGERFPRSTLGKVLMGFLAMAQFHLLPSWAFIRLKRKSQTELQVLSRRYALLNQMLTHLDVYILLFVTVRACIFARQADDRNTKDEALCSYASMLALVGLPWLAKRMMVDADSCVYDQPKEQRSGISNYYRGFSYYLLGELPEAFPLMELAAGQLSRIDDYRQTMPHHFLWHWWSVRGHSSKLLDHARKEEEIARRTNDKIILAYSWYGQAEGLARQGHTDVGFRLAEGAFNILAPLRATFLCVANVQKAKVQLQSGDYGGARESAWSAMKDIPKMRFLELLVPAFAIYVESVLTSEWTTNPKVITGKDRRRAGWVARLARVSGWVFPNNRPYANRVTGRLAAAKGKSKKAVRCFDKAIAAAETSGAEYEHARALIDKSMLHYPHAMKDRERGCRMMEDLECVLPVAEQQYLEITMQVDDRRRCCTNHN